MAIAPRKLSFIVHSTSASSGATWKQSLLCSKGMQQAGNGGGYGGQVGWLVGWMLRPPMEAKYFAPRPGQFEQRYSQPRVNAKPGIFTYPKPGACLMES